jgi:hypothetical protein
VGRPVTTWRANAAVWLGDPSTPTRLDDRFHESCHKRGDSSWFPAYVACAHGERMEDRGSGRLNCRLEMRILEVEIDSAIANGTGKPGRAGADMMRGRIV